MEKMLGAVLVCLSLLCSHAFGQTGLTNAEKQEILNAHNTFRSGVSPIATNMEEMVWSDELAMVAQNYAEQCVFEHNNDRLSQQSTFSSVGENLAAITGGTVNYTLFVERWNNEAAAYSYTSNSCSTVCGHYTQVVWATSRSVGCGAFRCANLQGFEPNAVVLVCNYGPSGNFVGQLPYSTGSESCSACPDDLPYCVQNLCSSTPAPTEPTSEPSTSTAVPTTLDSGSSSLINKPSVMTIATLLALVCSMIKMAM